MMIYIYIRNESKVLILSGSHGTEDGISGLTDKNQLEYEFYRKDCELLGIKPGPKRSSQRLPLKDWNGIPDITKPAIKEGRATQDSLLQNMDIRVCNLGYYYGQNLKLIWDIQKEIFSYLLNF